MKRWAFIIVFLYGAILILVTIPMMYLAFIGSETKIDNSVLPGYVFCAVFAIFLLCQMALLLVPVRIAEKRLVSRSSIIASIIGAGLMAGVLIAGIVVSVGETIIQDALDSSMWWIAFAGLLLMWALWGLIFWRWSKALEPKALIERQSRVLYRGSILELLIAIPAHIIARHRDYCCAGMSTFVGIVFGMSVMIFSFGPGVFFLYAERWKNSRVKQRSPNSNGPNRFIAAFLILVVIIGGAVLVHLRVFKKRSSELTITKDTKLQEIIFPSGSRIFFSNDRIESVTLSVPLTIQGIKCQRGTKIVGFWPSGKIRYTSLLSESQEIQGWFCAKDIEVSFYKSGKIHTAGLENGATIQGIYFPARSEIFFYESGRLKGARMSRVGGPFEINGISCDTRCEFYFYESGVLENVMLWSNQDIQGIPCAGSFGSSLHKHIRLYESGKLKEAALYCDKIINGVTYKKGSILEFSEDGSVLRAKSSVSSVE